MKKEVKKIIRKLITKEKRYKILVLKYKFFHLLKQKFLKFKDFFGIKNIKNERIYKEIAERVNKEILGLCGKRIKKCIYIFQLQFFDQKGINFFSGGAERYVIDLAKIFHNLGFIPILIQVGENNKKVWIKKKNGLIVVGVPSTFESYFKIISHLLVPKLAIYSGYQDWSISKEIYNPSILISHGVTWDTPYLNADIQAIKSTLNCFNYIVSVDTNTISYLRSTFSHDLSKIKKKMFYIPNYVDEKKFFPIQKTVTNKNIKITFPRRLCIERGYWLFSKIIDPILSKYENVNIELVGFIHDEEILINLNNLIKKFGIRIKHYLEDASKMHSIYQKTDISVIPTLFSEGTSLSCLEAMACQNTIIATNVGGLTNLIINDFNGILINPDENELFDALCRVIDDEKLRKELAKNALNISKRFTKQSWDEKWIKLIKDII